MPAIQALTYEEYLAVERETGARHEYVDGHALAMGGGSLRHSRLKVNLGGVLYNALRGSACVPYDSDAKVRVLATGLATYADFAVVCGPVERDPVDPLALTNPTALFEVLSPSTERWDRGGKFRHAQQIPSLRLYVLISPDEPRIEVYERIEGGWLYTAHAEGSVALEALGVEVPVAELYADLPADGDSPR